MSNLFPRHTEDNSKTMRFSRNATARLLLVPLDALEVLPFFTCLGWRAQGNGIIVKITR